MTKTILVLYFFIISILGMNKARATDNLLMEGICSFGFFIIIFVMLLFYLEWKTKKIKF